MQNPSYPAIINELNKISFFWKRIEVVITSLTRNQVVRKGTWVRITPLPLKKAAKKDVAYMNEPYYMGRKLISKCEEYDEGQRVMPVVGNGFSLKSDNTMYFSGASEKDEVFIRIENQSGEEVYLNILPTDGDGNYYFEYTPDTPFGDYTVYVNDGSIKETAFAYKEATD